MNKLYRTMALSAFGFILVSGAAYAQSPATGSGLPEAIGEGGTGMFQQLQGSSSSFLFNIPAVSGTGTAPSTYGFSEAFGGQSDQQLGLNGLSLNGSAYFTAPASSSSGSNQPKQAIDQSVSFQKGGLSLNLGYLNIDKSFSVDNSLLSSQPSSTSASLKDLLNKAGQTGITTGLNLNDRQNKFGMQFASIADSLHDQQKTSQQMTFEHDFASNLTLGFSAANTSTEQTTTGTADHQTTDVLHLAFSPTRSGFLLDGTSTRTLTDDGGNANDVLVKVAENFKTLNLASQFESSSNGSSSAQTTGWQSEKITFNNTDSNGLTFSGYWAKKSVDGGSGTDDFDTTIKAAETKYLQLAAEYAKSDDSPGAEQTKQTMTAKVTPNAVGPLGSLCTTLQIGNQQVEMLSGLQTASIAQEGIIKPLGSYDFLSGVKFYLAYASESSSSPTSKRTTHSARTLRLVSAPAGKNGLSWTVSQQQRLDSNGQPLSTASDYELKDALNQRLTVGVAVVGQLAQPDGTFADENQNTVNVAWNANDKEQFLAQYVHTKSLPQDIETENGYYVNYNGPVFNAQTVVLGLGEACKTDPTGANATGTTADFSYGWKTSETDLLNISSKLTDWQNHGFDGNNSPSVEETGQLNFKSTF